MKPKQRLEQKQTSRLYLRRKDHRDIIMNNTYHNAMWLKKTKDDGTVQDELVWCKYPKHALIGACGVENLGTITWMDVDRQFQYGYRQGGNRANTHLLDNGIAVFVSQTGLFRYRAYATLDGIVWKDLKIDDSVFGSLTMYHFGNNALIVNNGLNPIRFSALILDVDEDGEITSQVKTYNTGLNFGTCDYVCNTQDGFLFHVKETIPDYNIPRYNTYIYHLSVDGKLEQRWWEGDSRKYRVENPMGSNAYATYCNCGNKSIVLSCTVQKDNKNSSYYIYTLVCGATDDDGRTWTWYEFENEPWQSLSRTKIRNSCCVRDGEFFIFYGWDYKGADVKCFASYTGTAWNEIVLPAWVDLPTAKDGTCINPNVKDTLRVAIRPSATQNADIRLYDLLAYDGSEQGLNRRGYNILFKDGKACKDTDEDIYFCFGNWDGWILYFDNKYLTSSSKAFAWNLVKQSITNYVPETIQPYDYCVWESDYTESEEE